MFRILVVEDNRGTLEQLHELLSEEFPTGSIEIAEDVESGIKRFREAAQTGGFDAVVLDFKLPVTTGENPEVDSTICHEIVRILPDTLVIHITAYPDDAAIEKHLKEAHLKLREIGPKVVFLSKLELDWSLQLVKRLRSFLYGRRIEQQFDQLFSFAPPGETTSRFRPRYSGGVTHPVAALSRDIIAHWDELDESLRLKLQRYMNVVETAAGIRVSLLKL